MAGNGTFSDSRTAIVFLSINGSTHTAFTNMDQKHIRETQLPTPLSSTHFAIAQRTVQVGLTQRSLITTPDRFSPCQGGAEKVLQEATSAA